MLNWFLNGVGESSACTGSSMSWPCIAVPQGSALDPTKLAHLCQEVTLKSALANPFIIPHTLKLFQRPLRENQLTWLSAVLLCASTWLYHSTPGGATLLSKVLANRWRQESKTWWKPNIPLCWILAAVGKLQKLGFDPILKYILTQATRGLPKGTKAGLYILQSIILFCPPALWEWPTSVLSMLWFSHTMNKSFAFY